MITQHEANRYASWEEIKSGLCRCGEPIDPKTREKCRLTGAVPMCSECFGYLGEPEMLKSDMVNGDRDELDPKTGNEFVLFIVNRGVKQDFEELEEGE